MEMRKLKNRNRKILGTLNYKHQATDPEYKNYDSTDSDLYEEDDYLKIDIKEVRAEKDFLRKRRLERRYAIKEQIQDRLRQEQQKKKEAKSYKGQHRPIIAHSAPRKKPEKQKNIVWTKKKLDEIMAKCQVPETNQLQLPMESKLDTGLDDERLNPVMNDKRIRQRQQWHEQRMLNPLTYPQVTIREPPLNIMIPSEAACAKLADEGKIFFGNSQMENLVAAYRNKTGLLAVNVKKAQAENPALLREAQRPSIIDQHIKFQAKKMAAKAEEERLAALNKTNKKNASAYKFRIDVDALDKTLNKERDLDFSPVPPVDEYGNRPNSKMSERLSALREHRRSKMRLSQRSQDSSDDSAGSCKSFKSFKSAKSRVTHQSKRLNKSDNSEKSAKSKQLLKLSRSNKSFKSIHSKRSDKSSKSRQFLNTITVSGTAPFKTLDSNFRFNFLASQQTDRSPPSIKEHQQLSLDVPGTADHVKMPYQMKRGGKAVSPNMELSQRQMKLKLYRLLESKNTSQRIQARNRFQTIQPDETARRKERISIQQQAFNINLHNRNLTQGGTVKNNGYLNKRNHDRYRKASQTSNKISKNQDTIKFNTDLTEESCLNQSSRVPKLPAMSNSVTPFGLQIDKSIQSSTFPAATGRSATLGAVRERHNRTTNTHCSTGNNTRRTFGGKIKKKMANLQSEIDDLYQQSVMELEDMQYASIDIEDTTEADTIKHGQRNQQKMTFQNPKNSMSEESQFQARTKTASVAVTQNTPKKRQDLQDKYIHQKRGSAATAAFSRNNLECTISRLDSGDLNKQGQTIYSDWEMLDENVLSKAEFKATLEKISQKYGGFPNFTLRDLPLYRTEMTQAINRTQQEDVEQLVPKLPKCIKKNEGLAGGNTYDKTKVNASYLSQQKQKQIYNIINQNLMALYDEPILRKYYAYLRHNNIQIVTDAFERMDLYRRIHEGLRKLQAMDGLTEEQFQQKKAALMRSMNKKQAAHIYGKPEKRKSSENLTTAEKLLKYANSLKFDQSKAQRSDSLMKSNLSSPVSPGKMSAADNEFFQAREDSNSPLLKRRMVPIHGSDIKEEQNEESDIISLNNLSHGHASAVQEAECETDDSELAELKARVGLINPISVKRKQRSNNKSPQILSPRLQNTGSPNPSKHGAKLHNQETPTLRLEQNQKKQQRDNQNKGALIKA